MAAGLEIHEAASTGDFDSLEEYLRSGKFDVNLRDEEWNGRTALHWACAKGYVECIRLLLDYGAIGTARNDVGWTPAHFAAETGKLTAIRALYNANVSIGLKDKYGDTPRRISEIYGQHECVKFFEQCSVEEAAGLKPKGLSPKFTSVFRHKRASRISNASTSSRSCSPSPSQGTNPGSPRSSVGSAVEDQNAKGIDNNAEYVPDPDRES